MDRPEGTLSVLHVDDDPEFGELATIYLDREIDALDRSTVQSAADGLDAIHTRPIECVVSDFQMPDMDGLEFLDAIRATYAIRDGSGHHLSAVTRALARLGDLIEDLAAVIRQEDLVTNVRDVSLGAVSRAIWDTLPTGEATLQVESDAPIRADHDALVRLLENRFRDAIEHGGPAVTVRIGPIHGGFFLGDDGPGIPPAQRAVVLDSGVSTKEDGTGFGLASCRQIATAHGWDLAITDTVDFGARLEFTGVEPTSPAPHPAPD